MGLGDCVVSFSCSFFLSLSLSIFLFFFLFSFFFFLFFFGLFGLLGLVLGFYTSLVSLSHLQPVLSLRTAGEGAACILHPRDGFMARVCTRILASVVVMDLWDITVYCFCKVRDS
jgi:multisubunit Na+/H+ antiporter MnhE subunit